MIHLRCHITAKRIDATCQRCRSNAGFLDTHFDGTRLLRGGFRCLDCGAAEAFVFASARGRAHPLELDLQRAWEAFRERILHYSRRAALDPKELLPIRSLELLHEAASIFGRRDIFDFSPTDVEQLSAYLFEQFRRAGLMDARANGLLSLIGLKQDLALIRPLLLQAEMVKGIIAPSRALIALVGFQAIIPGRVARAGTVYALGHLAWELMRWK